MLSKLLFLTFACLLLANCSSVSQTGTTDPTSPPLLGSNSEIERSVQSASNQEASFPIEELVPEPPISSNDEGNVELNLEAENENNNHDQIPNITTEEGTLEDLSEEEEQAASNEMQDEEEQITSNQENREDNGAASTRRLSEAETAEEAENVLGQGNDTNLGSEPSVSANDDQQSSTLSPTSQRNMQRVIRNQSTE